MPVNEIATIKNRVKALPPEQKVELIKFLADSLSAESLSFKPLEFGKYANNGRKTSTPDDFKIAEWHPSESELNGH